MSIPLLIPVVLLALFCEYVDSVLGMGYGTTLTPILLLMGYTPAEIVPAVLLSEFVTGLLAGLIHHEVGNVDLAPGTRAFKVAVTLGMCSVVGAVVAVFIAVNIPAWMLRLYVGALVLAVGVGILLTAGRRFAFSWKKVVGLGFLAALNKGLSGGGYGPLVCGGQLLSGVGEKEAVGITSLAEGLTCIVGVIAYVLTGNGVTDWRLAPSLALGALLSVPLAVLTVKKVSLSKMRWAIGGAVTALGCFTLFNLI